jgi:hypothetical protein
MQGLWNSLQKVIPPLLAALFKATDVFAITKAVCGQTIFLLAGVKEMRRHFR